MPARRSSHISRETAVVGSRRPIDNRSGHLVDFVRQEDGDPRRTRGFDMEVEQNALPIELDAVKLGIEWKHRFAAELKAEAIKLAGPSSLVTVEHYRQAAPVAISTLLKILTAPPSKDDAARRAA
jgi:hypothetical protein